MPTYTGPVPATPGGASSAADWQNWWSYQTIVQNLRYETERAERVLVTDRQHIEKITREDANVAATDRLSAATQAHAAAYLTLPPVDEAAVVRSLRSIAAHEAQSVAINALAVAIASRAAAPIPGPSPAPSPAPMPTPVGLVAETVAVARAWAAAYAPAVAIAEMAAEATGPVGTQILPPAKKPQV